MSTTVDDIEIGQIISFRSKSSSDNNFYYGKVIGFITSEVAASYFDIYTYNSNVQTADDTVPEVSEQTFILIKLIDKLDDTEKYIITFSKDWITDGTISIHSNKKILNINIYNVEETAISDIQNLLLTNGFNSKVILYS